jgi:hypothetical protein
MKRTFIFSAICLLFFTACERVIDIDLNEASPALVIEGRVLLDSLAYVELHETRSYFRPDMQPCVCNAIVLISENGGLADTLQQIEPGTYQSRTLRGKSGATYSLSVLYKEKSFNAESFLYPKPGIFSLTQRSFASFGDFGDSSAFDFGNGLLDSLPSFLFTNIYDDPDEENYYRFEYCVNGRPRTGRYFISDDKNAANDTLKYSPGPTALFNIGDTVSVRVYAIDKGVYSYLNMLNDALNTNSFVSSTPYNPYSNISNGALGYFAAMSMDCDTTIIRFKPEDFENFMK